MLSLSDLVRIYVCLTPTDMRKSFDSLAAVVREGFPARPDGRRVPPACEGLPGHFPVREPSRSLRPVQ